MLCLESMLLEALMVQWKVTDLRLPFVLLYIVRSEFLESPTLPSFLRLSFCSLPTFLRLPAPAYRTGTHLSPDIMRSHVNVHFQLTEQSFYARSSLPTLRYVRDPMRDCFA
jgi:hypothetical protein